uniref:Matrilin 2 n=1 Tax=Callorhinchus milii TaxID=7868 RepID=A0A4W3GLC5_CALMI
MTGKALDLIFIIDSSRSVRPEDYEKVKLFLINILKFLDVGLDKTRVGLVLYGSTVEDIFSLKTYKKKADMVRAIKDMEHLESGTMTGLAIQHTMNVAFTEGAGARPLARNVPRVAIIVTDGRPQDRVTEVAAQARDSGILIFAVGVGRVDMSILRLIGSEPHDNHVFLVQNFSMIETLLSGFQSKICGIDSCALGNHGCEHRCINTETSFICQCHDGYTLNPDGKSCERINLCALGNHGCEHDCENTEDSYVCRCQQGYTLNSDGKTCQQCAKEALDLVFVIDGSKSLGPQNFHLVKQFVSSIVGALEVSPNATRVGLVQYSTKVRTEFALGRHTTARGIKEAVSQVRYMGRGSKLGLALQQLSQSSFTDIEGVRSPLQDASKVAVVFIDSHAQDDVSQWATKAKQNGIIIYAVGVGDTVESKLQQIASHPQDKYSYHAEDFSAIGEIAEKLKTQICKGTLRENVVQISLLHTPVYLEVNRNPLVSRLKDNFFKKNYWSLNPLRFVGHCCA